MSLFLLAPSAAHGEVAEARSFDGEDWTSGLVDLRSSDLRNAQLIPGGLSESALAVTIPRGSFRGLGPFDRLAPAVDEAWYRYHVLLTDFEPQSSGKLPGLSGLYSRTAKGCLPSKPGAPGWSARGLFGAAGTRGAAAGHVPIGLYVYHLDQPRTCGEAMYWENSNLRPGRWHCIEGQVQLNTPGKNDGMIRGWLDGVQRFTRESLAFRRSAEANIQIREMWLDIYYGGKTPTDDNLGLTIDEVAVSPKGRVGCLDHTTDVVGSFATDSAIASFEPSTGGWSLLSPSGGQFDQGPIAALEATDSWTRHLVGDFTGDGGDDIASFDSAQNSWWISSDDGWSFSSKKWSSLDPEGVWVNHVSGDFSGEGLDEIASYNAKTGEWWVSKPTRLANWDRVYASISWTTLSEPTAIAASQVVAEVVRGEHDRDAFIESRWETHMTVEGWDEQLAGDFNGDGRHDIVSYFPATGSVLVSTSHGDGFSTTRWERRRTLTGWTKHLVGDFDGDGLDDFASFHPGTGKWVVSRSTGSSFQSSGWITHLTNSRWTTHLVGDFDGDNVDDIANYHPGTGNWVVSRSTRNGFKSELWANLITRTGWTSQVVGDFNHDGRSDIANFHAASGRWVVGISSGDGFETSLWSR